MLSIFGFSTREPNSVVSFSIQWSKSKRRGQAVFYGNGTIILEVACTDDPLLLRENSISYLRENFLDLRRRIIEILYKLCHTASISTEDLFPLPESLIVCKVHFNLDANPPKSFRFESLPEITFAEMGQTLRLYLHKKLGRLKVEVCKSPNMTWKGFFKRLGIYAVDLDKTPSYIC